MTATLHDTAITLSASLPEACAGFLAALRTWIDACLDDLRDAPILDGHDQGTVTTSWATEILAHNDTRALAYMRRLRDRAHAHFTHSGQWRHGYWVMQEAHHGTEHFDLFLGTLWRLDRQDGATIAQFIDAAEHLGNWADDCPAWFDWDTGLFRSMYFGTAGIKPDAKYALNVADHFRCVNLSLLAHAMTGEARYLALAEAHAGRWTAAILDGETLPAGLTPSGPLYAFTDDAKSAYWGFAGMAGLLNTDVDRAENLLASGAVDGLLQLWSLTGTAAYLQAAERLLDVLATQLADPDAGAVAAVIRRYRELTGSDRYDAQVCAAAAACRPGDVRALAMLPIVARDRRPVGVGKRTDMPEWREDDRPRRFSPLLLALSAQIQHDDTLATWAIDLAHAYFRLARAAYPHGHTHGCSARTVSAIARGHGRENNAGVVTAVLHPLLFPGKDT